MDKEEINEIESLEHEKNVPFSLDEIYASIEAILFASGESVNYAKLSAVLEIPMWQLMNIMRDFKDEYNRTHRGVQLILLEQSAQLCTREEYSDIIKKALADKAKGQLSKAALEVLAVIAYKQPTTKAYIEQVRGVESGSTINLLCEKKLVECCGRLDVPGRPFTYKTTDNFLRCFGLMSTDDLPELDTFMQTDIDDNDINVEEQNENEIITEEKNESAE